MSAVEQALAVAGEFSVSAIARRESGFECTLTVALPSGEHVAFDLEVSPGIADHLNIKERASGRLPRCCPDRHITPRNSFCLNWISGDPQPVIDRDSARSWWASLWDYLTRQITAGKIGRWPGPARAHGKAVIYQDRAERCAAKLGEDAQANLAQGRFETRIDQRRGRNRIELLLGESTINRIRVVDRMLTNYRTPCLCPKGIATGVSIGSCDDHAGALAGLIDAIHRWNTSEKEYFVELRKGGIKCCQTLRHCRLKQA